MRRTFFYGIGTLLLLTACGWRSLPPGEVLERETLAVQNLRSAHFDVHIALGAQDVIDLKDGVTQDGGRQMRFTVERAGAKADVVIAGPSETYLRLDALGDAGGDEKLVPFLGEWRRIVGAGGAPASAIAITPDPALLRAQAEVITVEQDLGKTQLEKNSVYHYRVQIDPEKLLTFLRQSAAEVSQPFDETAIRSLLKGTAAQGEVWIDVKSFLPRRISWVFTSSGSLANGTNFVLTVTDHNVAEPLSLPTADKTLSAGMQRRALRLFVPSQFIGPETEAEQLLLFP